ncbi:unnamed protein product [Durusdinium trenchii]|uniref:Uncharacterized protein n=1 Tax=Durusdinium trenchii TaxID=1381693 RepID=A0ABP0MYX4_9DINO
MGRHVPSLRIPQVRFPESCEEPQSLEHQAHFRGTDPPKFPVICQPQPSWCRRPWFSQAQAELTQLGPGPSPRALRRRPGEVQLEIPAEISQTPDSTPVAQNALGGDHFKQLHADEQGQSRQTILWVHVPGNVVPSKDAYKSAISGQNILEERLAEIMATKSSGVKLYTCTCR